MDTDNSKKEVTTGTSVPSQFLHKVCLLGGIGSGKTSYLKKLVYNTFSPHPRQTIGVDFALKEKQVNDETIRLQIWEIAGAELSGKMTRIYYKEASGVFIMSNPINKYGLDDVIKWKSDIDSKLSDDYLDESLQARRYTIPFILLVSKTEQNDFSFDFFDNKKYDDIADFCTKLGFHDYAFISSQTGAGVEDSCDRMIELLRLRREEMKNEDSSS
jgi:small GTP-binding protein